MIQNQDRELLLRLHICFSNSCKHTHTHACTRTHRHTRIFARIILHIHTHTHMHTHMHTHTHTHKHTHTNSHLDARRAATLATKKTRRAALIQVRDPFFPTLHIHIGCNISLSMYTHKQIRHAGQHSCKSVVPFFVLWCPLFPHTTYIHIIHAPTRKKKTDWAGYSGKSSGHGTGILHFYLSRGSEICMYKHV